MTSTLVLGIGWAAWHVPLFFIAGVPQHDTGSLLWAHALGIVALSCMFTAIYNRTGRSMAAMLGLHFMNNFVGTLLPVDQMTETVVLVIVAVAIVVVGLPQPAAPSVGA